MAEAAAPQDGIEVEEPQGEQGERRGRNPLGWLVLFAAIAILLSQFLGDKGPKVGGEAPDLSLVMLDGGEAKLGAFRGQVVLLDFWATWCPPCVDSLPLLQRIAEEYEEEGLVTIAVNRDEGRNKVERVEAFLEHHGLTRLNVALDDGTAAGSFQVRALPTLVMIDREGQVEAAQVGAMGERELRAFVEAALREAD